MDEKHEEEIANLIEHHHHLELEFQKLIKQQHADSKKEYSDLKNEMLEVQKKNVKQMNIPVEEPDT